MAGPARHAHMGGATLSFAMHRRDEPEGDGAEADPDAPGIEPVPELVLAGRAFYRGRLQPLEIGIDADGWIVELGRTLRGARRHDVGDRLILPAATDPHVHFRFPDVPRGVESWGTGTVQAALGGVGLAGEMPNTEPPVTTAERLVERRERGEGRLAVDLLLYAAAAEPRAIAEVARECGAFKLYMSPTSGIDRPVAPAELAPTLQAVAATGLPLSVHAEDTGKFVPEPVPTSPSEWNAARPPEAERNAVGLLVRAAPPSLRLHVAHVTTLDVAEYLEERGISFEATPHHLLLSARAELGTRGKVNPPLRTERTRRALFTAFAAGRVPMLASDHAPHPPEMKERPFALAPSGMPGVATMLPLLLAQARDGNVPLATLLAAACDRPARWFGVPMGRIEVGHRARLLVVDPRQRKTVHAARLPIPCGWTAFEGWEAVFPQEHYRDGVRIVEGAEYVGRPEGVFVRPEYAPSAPEETERPRTALTEAGAGSPTG
jgi:dihydroorotase